MGAVLLAVRAGRARAGRPAASCVYGILRVLHNLVGIAVLHDLALMHHHDAVGQHIDHGQDHG